VLGRVFQRCNPYRIGGACQAVTTSYDELDRPLDVTYQDGSVARTRYTDNAVLSRDANGRWRKTTTDALGRLDSVVEDAAGTMLANSTLLQNPSNGGTPANHTTRYGYDARGNLKSVLSATQSRVFTYDTMGRLRSASLPETGASAANGITTYAYDEAGNLIRRQDARGFVTAYAYDELNRLTRKQYSVDDPSPVSYCYDGSTAAIGCAGAPSDPAKNLRGRLTMVHNDLVDMIYSEYDALGRVTKSAQRFAGASSYNFQYAYNDLQLQSITYPSGRSVIYGFDAAGRMNGVCGVVGAAAANCAGLSGAQTYIGGVSYTPQGQPQQVNLAGGRLEYTCYNSRLQPVTMMLRTQPPGATGCADTSSTTMWITLGYDPVVMQGQVVVGGNNGNVARQEIYDAGGGWAVTQNYTYDMLNRLQTAVEQGAAGWSRSYGYDSFGNQWVAA
jgi:YD repeat-containing protein